MPIPFDPITAIEELARSMVEDIMESSTPKDIDQLIRELQAKLRERKRN
jgi:hypothetical protein